MRHIWMTMMMACLALQAGAAAGSNELANPGFEQVQPDGVPTGWRVYSGARSFRTDREVTHGGGVSVLAERRPGGEDFGLMQEVVYERPSRAPILFGGWSRAERVTGHQDYNIYLDVEYEDGTFEWAFRSLWNQETGAESSFDWRHTFSCVRPEKPVRRISYYVMLRKEAHGKVWFDDFELRRGEPDVQMGPVTMQSAAPLSWHGVLLEAPFFREVSWRAAFRGADGRELRSQSGRSGGIRWLAELSEPASSVEIEVSAGGKTHVYELPVTARPSLPRNPVTGAWRVWTADSMTNVSPATYPAEDGAGADIRLELARAEAESAQILVTAGSGPVTRAEVSLSALRREGDGAAFRGSVTWERVGYVARKRPFARHPEGYGDGEMWLPDPLLPARPFAVPANATQGVWVTVTAARDAEPGTYRGEATLTLDGATARVPLSVTVFGFALPETFGLRTAFSLMDNFLCRPYPEGDRDALRRQAWDILLDHRLNPDDITRTSEPRLEDLLHARSRGMNSFNIFQLVPKPKDNPLWFYRSPISAYNAELIAEFKSRLEPIVAELRRHDLLKYAYLYGFDEVESEYYPIVSWVHEEMRRLFPELPIMTTARNYRDWLKDRSRTDCAITDWFCPVVSVYDEDFSAELRRRGHQVWWYVCCVPQHPYANFDCIEYPFIEGRLLPWMTFWQRADGLLFWHVNAWQDGSRLDESVCYQPSFRLLAVMNSTGDGQLLYPGERGPLPSIRLANIRDGLEDYEYLTLAGDISWSFRAELAPSAREFSRDASRLRAIRRRLAAAIEQRQGVSSPSGWLLEVEGRYRLHLQGYDRNGRGEHFWSFTKEVVKTDAQGRVLLRRQLAEAPYHLGDLCCHDGKVYVTCARITDYAKGSEGSTVRVYSQEDLTLLQEFPISDTFGCDGITATPDGFAVAVCRGALKGNVSSPIYEYDRQFRLRRVHELTHRPVYAAIQCLKRRPGGGYIASLYGNLLFQLDESFRVVAEGDADASVGLVVEEDGGILRAVHHSQRERGWAVHLERLSPTCLRPRR